MVTGMVMGIVLTWASNPSGPCVSRAILSASHMLARASSSISFSKVAVMEMGMEMGMKMEQEMEMEMEMEMEIEIHTNAFDENR